MDLFRPPPELVPFALRALKMVALADGALSPAERDTMEAARELFAPGLAVDLDALPPISPEELAARLPVPAGRRQIVRGMVVLSLADGEASPEEAALIERFARGLGVESQDLATLRLLADHHLVRARFDIARRFWAREKSIELARERGFGWVASTLAYMAGLKADDATTTRYRGLEASPAGSLGRAYFDFVLKNGFPFPGEKGAGPETLVFHDLTHVLSGYDTDPAGELQVLSFHAGCRREEKDPFSFVLFALAEFQIGLALSPLATTSKGQLDPRKMLRAIDRGVACRVDPTDAWDPWPVMNEPLEALRERYGIPGM